MLKTRNVRFRYDSEHAFHMPDLSLSSGEDLLVLGSSGSGKTTLLNILGGLLRPQEGEVVVGDTSIYDLKGAALDKFRGRHIGMVFQKPHILAPLTVRENLQLAAYLSGGEGFELDEILAELNIGPKADAKIQNLSEGEAQRVSIARALVNHPKVILADEPTASLDDANAERVINLLKSQAKKLNSILIVVTHDQRVKNHFDKQITVQKIS
jgi:lipoprotein-releasing system ATP-binding protein